MLAQNQIAAQLPAATQLMPGMGAVPTMPGMAGHIVSIYTMPRQRQYFSTDAVTLFVVKHSHFICLSPGRLCLCI